MLRLGDLQMLADPRPPAKMIKALAAIALKLHAAYDEVSELPPGAGYDKCLFMSLAVRDFLAAIGYADATVRACGLFVAAETIDEGEQIWSVGIGVPGQNDVPGKFNSHAVCTVPSLDLLIDTTLYQAIRPHWMGAITGMLVTNYTDHPFAKEALATMYGRPVICGAEKELEDRRVTMLWIDRPEVNWKREPDFRNKNERRRHVTRALVHAFGPWDDD